MRPRYVRPTLALFAAAVAALAVPAWAAACPFCDGGPAGANPVRAEVFGPDFWPNALAAAAPFAVTLAAAAVHFWPPARRRPDPAEAPDAG